jgi:hypothetical protein
MTRWLMLPLAAMLVGCSVAPKAIRATYPSYNEAIAFNESQQMLLNLVRLKYRETPLFLKVGALSTSFDFSANGRASFGRAGETDAYGLDIGGSLSQRPTITYTPLEGDTFVKQVLTEVDGEVFALLIRAGWPIRTLCHVMVEKIGNAINNEDEPSYARFNAIVDALEQAQDRDALRFHAQEDGLYLQVIGGLTIEGGETIEEERLIPMSTFLLRSFLDIMFFLGKNTEVPESQRDHVRDSTPNGWIRIRSSRSRPDDAMVWVQHHGYYFSIAAADIKSKDTFALMRLLYQMQAGDVRSVQPVLTLPIAQP